MVNHMRDKTFKTLDQQINILKEKGLVINDIDFAKKVLFKENYFFLSGYRYLFMTKYKEKKFNDGTTFDELYSVFLFDRHIRNLMFKNILIIENNIKSIMSYQLSKKYGFKEKDYLNPDNFTKDPMREKQVYDVLGKMKRQIRVNGKQHTATQHYMFNYGYIPMWILVKVLSFGLISELYLILKNEDKEAISNFYEIDIEEMGTYLNLLSNFRNICAHEDILYDHRTQRLISDTEFHYKLDIPKDEEGIYKFGKNDLFAMVIILRQMLEKDEFIDFLRELEYEINLLDSRVNTVPLNSILNRIGFPDNWFEISKI
jgi:abortive infection bacteriophage resistance protein